MNQQPILILIPSHGLEDFPTDCNEDEAAGLLNAFSATWHPLLLNETQRVPDWDRADLPLEEFEGRVVVIPSASIDHLPSGWKQRALAGEATLIEKKSDREELLNALLDCLEEKTIPGYPEAEDLIADFIALGTAHLMVQLLTRKMHHYTELDEKHFEKRAIEAASQFVKGDVEETKRNLNICFELLLEARERCYAIDCYLIDLCLLIPRLANEHLTKRLDAKHPMSLFVTTEDLHEIANTSPEILEKMKLAVQEERLSFVGGQWADGPTPLQPVTSTLWQLGQGVSKLNELIDSSPVTWGARRFSLSTEVPQLASMAGITNAVHWAFDDGQFPAEEQSMTQWEGRDGTTLNASTRLPLSADSAVSFLRFPEMMSESMDHDHVAMLALAHWPEVKTPWFDDCQRISNYAPVLGQWKTLHHFLDDGEPVEHFWMQNQRDYRTPYLSQSVAQKQTNPISGYENFLSLRRRFDSIQTCAVLASLLKKTALTEEEISELQNLELLLESSGLEGDQTEQKEIGKQLDDISKKVHEKLASAMGGEKVVQTVSGLLVFNPVSARKKLTVTIPERMNPPKAGGAIQFVQCDEVRRICIVDVPGTGFVWIPAGEIPDPDNGPSDPLLAEEHTLRNEFFELQLNPDTGAIFELKNYGRSPNRIGQQIAYRFPADRTITYQDGNEDPTNAVVRTTPYSIMAADSFEITSDGPTLGEIVSKGRLVDPGTGDTLSTFQQTTRVWRGRPDVEIEIELEPTQMPSGNPWKNYYATRFAWADTHAHLTGSSMQNSFSLGAEFDRFESSEYIEIVDDKTRTTIFPYGRPFHVKTGERMLDSILIVEGESKRTFKYQISVEEPLPMPAAMHVTKSAVSIPISGKGLSTPSGWFFHLNAKNVILNRLIPVASDDSKRRFIAEVIETEGNYQNLRLRCLFPPHAARQVSLVGKTIMDLTVEDDAVVVEMRPYEVAHLEIELP